MNIEVVDILLVDDREENLIALEASLENLHYNFVKFQSGNEVLRYLLDHTPALILLDVRMPDMNGFELASLIKSSERTREIPIIFITALSKGDQFEQMGYKHGAVDYIYKPFDATVLRTKVAVFAEISRQHARISRLVSLQRSATEALADSTDLGAAMVAVLRNICKILNFDLGLFWNIDSFNRTLICQAQWHDYDPASAEFIATRMKYTFVKGAGLPGRTWLVRNPQWLSEFSSDVPLLSRENPGSSHLRTALALPICVKDEVFGVMEFYSHTPLRQDPKVLEILAAIGSQIGQVIKRATAMETARAIEARKTAILETAKDSIISVDQEGNILDFNPAAELTFKLRQGDVIGKNALDLLLPARNKTLIERALRRYLSANRTQVSKSLVEITGQRADGSEFPAELSVSITQGVKPQILTGFVRDITNRKRTEQNSKFLAKASASLSSSLKSSEIYSELASLATYDVANWCVIELIHEDTQALEVVAMSHRLVEKKALMEAQIAAGQSGWIRYLGSLEVVGTGLPVITSGTTDFAILEDLGFQSAMTVPMRDAHRTIGAVTFVSSELGRIYTKDDVGLAEELLRRASFAIDNSFLYRKAQDAIKSREEFFSIASHELKTPITSLKMIQQMTQLQIKSAKAGSLAPEKLSQLLETSIRQVDKLTTLVDDLLDVAKIRSGKLNVQLNQTDLSELVTEVVGRYSESLNAARCKLELSLQENVIGLWDQTRIEQVIVNLISNSIKYAPGRPIRIEVNADANWAKLAIQDSGPGIPSNLQGKVFDQYERVSSSKSISGLGLGLFITRQIVELHQGHIRVESQLGKGAKFTVELPISSVKSQARTFRFLT